MRPFEESDAEAALGWFGDPLVMKYIPNGPDLELADTQRRIALYRDHQATHGFSKWVVVERDSGLPVGDAGLMVLEQEDWIDLGFRLLRRCRGRGLATEAASAWIRAAFTELDIPTLGAFAHPDNRASIRVLEKLGFRRQRVDTVMGIAAVIFELKPSDSPGFEKQENPYEKGGPLRSQR